MPTDLARSPFNRLNHYTTVLAKQGAVGLEYEHNVNDSMIGRRLEALGLDVLGVDAVPRTTPDAFKISLDAAAPSTLLIGKGREYVHGKLAENHGSIKSGAVFDPLLGESTFSGPISYFEQPYFRPQEPLPTSGMHIVYLEVWQREVTHVQDPDLIEVAVGVETSSRLQTAWQVRLLASPGVTCSSTPQEWLDLIAPSTGRLSTGYVPVPPAADPCELPPTGGYRGLENQLYRIQIHDPGQPGQGATFKWARNNASGEFAVEEVLSPTKLRLQSVGRDDVLGLHAGDWVEVTSDDRELSPSAGEMRQITTVTPELRTIDLSSPLPPTLAPLGEVNSGAELRVTLWNHRGLIQQVGPGGALLPFHDLDNPSATFPNVALGVIPVPAPGTTLVLENGLTVSFDSEAGKGFKHFDYWHLVARTDSAEAEHLHAAPPLGEHHHFARLAVYDADHGTVTDCRTLWPPAGKPGEVAQDCACTVCVTPESHSAGSLTIQDAIKEVAGAGGTVCLAPGEYHVAEPIRIERAQSVAVRGPSPALHGNKGAMVDGPKGVFLVSASDGIEVAGLFLKSATVGVQVENSGEVVLRHLVIDAPQGIALKRAVPNLRILHNQIRGKVGIGGEELDHAQGWVIIEGNRIIHESEGITLQKVQANGATIILRNRLQGKGRGLDLSNATEDAPASTTIAGNQIELVEGYAIRCNAKRLTIRENHIASLAVADEATVVVGLDALECDLIDNLIEIEKSGSAILSQARKTGIRGNRVVIGQILDRRPGVQVEATECFFSDNSVEVQSTFDGILVMLRTELALVSANRVISRPGGRSSIALNVSSGAATILGNMTVGQIQAPNGATPQQWPDFNVQS